MKNLNKLISMILILSFAIVLFTKIPMISADNETLVDISIPSISDEYEAGKIIVGMKTAYYGDIRDVFPELDIYEYQDIYKEYADSVIAKNGEISQYLQSVLNKEFVISLSEKSKEAVIEALNILIDNPYISYAQANNIYKTSAVVPDDEYYYDPINANMQWGHLKIETSNLWEYITGGDVLVGVLDSGVDYNHPDLDDNLEMSLAYNAYNITSNDVMDYDGHGTQVAGIIAAEGNNEIGVAGVVWDIDIVPIKITDSNPNNDLETNTTAIINAIVYMLDNEIMISNISYGLGDDAGVRQAIHNYSLEGGLIIIAAGNYPVSLDDYDQYSLISGMSGVVIVGALAYSASEDFKCSFSAYGENTVHLFAPGEAILTTTVPGAGNPYTYAYTYCDGTSFAAPFVTGVVALLKLANPTLPNHIIKNAIINGAVYSSYLDGKCVADGRLDALGAFNAVGKRITVDPNIENGSVTASGIVSPSNRSVMVTVDPDPGYWLKPGSLVYHYSVHYVGSISAISLNYYYFTMPNAHVTITAEFYMIGDVNLDGVIDISDALAALRHASGQEVLTGDALLAADVNGDGSVTQADSNIILNYYSGAIDSFPIEG